jgi:hypothetical protein
MSVDNFQEIAQEIVNKAQRAVDDVIDRQGKAAKGAWKVQAGVVPGSRIAEYDRVWFYTVEDYDRDGEHANDPKYLTKYNELQWEAMRYYLQISDPRVNNWADLQFIWY